jgi:hypothetical protein
MKNIKFYFIISVGFLFFSQSSVAQNEKFSKAQKNESIKGSSSIEIKSDTSIQTVQLEQYHTDRSQSACCIVVPYVPADKNPTLPSEKEKIENTEQPKSTQQKK